MNVNDYTVMNSQYYQLTDKVDDYKKNYDLIESIMELERDLMSPESSQADTSIQVSYIFLNFRTNLNNI